MKKTLFIMLVCFTFYHCRYNSRAMANDVSKAPSTFFEPGKCYAKCLMPDITVYDTVKTIIYTGNPKLEDVNLEKVTLEVKPAKKEWKKVKTTANCLSPNPADCEAWCHVDVPAETKTYMVLQDTLQTKNFRIQETYKVKKVIKGGYNDYTEVLCPSQITTALITSIQRSLLTKTNCSLELNGKYDKRTKTAITSYQKQNALMQGNVTIEFLKHLGVSY